MARDEARAAAADAVFASAFGGAPDGVAIAPGRVNLIGEHTDYNDGLVLPMAIDLAVSIAFKATNGRVVRVHSAMNGETVELGLDDACGTHPGWGGYVAGVAWAMQQAGSSIRGADLAIHSDLPSGAGLSSSAALEVATHMALASAAGLPWNAPDAARVCRRAENEYLGVSCGIMDQFASAASTAGHAMMLDCRSLESEYVALPQNGTFVVIDTGVRRTLSGSEYNDRRESCERVVAYFRAQNPAVRALRDITEEQLDKAQRKLAPTDFHRAWHVVAENHRVLTVLQGFRENQPRHVGAALNVSHDSLQVLYDVSCDELDAAVDCARDHPACYGARMTGAGFGGCAIAYVATPRVAEFIAAVGPALASAIVPPIPPFACEPAAGARLAR